MIKEPFILKSLQELLASSASADELQFEVLQVLGMQGDAFDITAQILEPATRPVIAELLKPTSPRNRRAAARAQNGDGNFALPTSQAEADAMIQAQLAQAQNRPLWTGEHRVSLNRDRRGVNLTDLLGRSRGGTVSARVQVGQCEQCSQSWRTFGATSGNNNARNRCERPSCGVFPSQLNKLSSLSDRI